MVDGYDISNPHSKCLASDQNAPVLSTSGGDRDSGSTSSIHPELSRSISSAAWQQTQCCSGYTVIGLEAPATSDHSPLEKQQVQQL
jgi:hypothetical protein